MATNKNLNGFYENLCPEDFGPDYFPVLDVEIFYLNEESDWDADDAQRLVWGNVVWILDESLGKMDRLTGKEALKETLEDFIRQSRVIENPTSVLEYSHDYKRMRIKMADREAIREIEHVEIEKAVCTATGKQVRYLLRHREFVDFDRLFPLSTHYPNDVGRNFLKLRGQGLSADEIIALLLS